MDIKGQSFFVSVAIQTLAGFSILNFGRGKGCFSFRQPFTVGLSCLGQLLRSSIRGMTERLPTEYS